MYVCVCAVWGDIKNKCINISDKIFLFSLLLHQFTPPLSNSSSQFKFFFVYFTTKLRYKQSFFYILSLSLFFSPFFLLFSSRFSSPFYPHFSSLPFLFFPFSPTVPRTLLCPSPFLSSFLPLYPSIATLYPLLLFLTFSLSFFLHFYPLLSSLFPPLFTSSLPLFLPFYFPLSYSLFPFSLPLPTIPTLYPPLIFLPFSPHFSNSS